MPGIDRLLLTNAVMGQFLTGFASRIFIVALPTIAAALDADILGISWALIAYQLAGISLSVVFGRVGDVHGRYAIYGLGFAILAATSLLCGLAANVLLLVLFRAFQGIGAAMISSATRVLAMDAMPEGSEGKANGLMTMSYHSGFLIGPPLGGLVIDWLGWRWVFFLLVPLGVTGVVLTAMRARRVQAVTRGDRPPIDYVGAGAPRRDHRRAHPAARPEGRRPGRSRPHECDGPRSGRRRRGIRRPGVAGERPRRQLRAVQDPDVHGQRGEPARPRHGQQRARASCCPSTCRACSACRPRSWVSSSWARPWPPSCARA